MVATCRLCGEWLQEDRWVEIENGDRYCHHVDWILREGTCYEQYIVSLIPELAPWLELCWECDGCEPDALGECTCVN